jgi:predicted GNAT family N-acyltransferase
MSLQWKMAFDALSVHELYLLRLRRRSLVVEQTVSILIGKDEALAPNRRVWRWNSGTCPPFKPGISFDNAIGRVVVDANHRTKKDTFNAEAIAELQVSIMKQQSLLVHIWRSFTKVTVCTNKRNVF